MRRMKNLILFTCAFALALGLAACGDDSNQAAPESTAATQGQPADDAQDAASTAGELGIAASDLANADQAIEFGDFDAMSALSSSLSQAAADGAVVEVDGIVKNYGTSYSIVEENADGNQRIGVIFVIDGVGEDAYPQDGQRARITGKVLADETGYTCFLATLPQFVQVA